MEVLDIFIITFEIIVKGFKVNFIRLVMKLFNRRLIEIWFNVINEVSNIIILICCEFGFFVDFNQKVDWRDRSSV